MLFICQPTLYLFYKIRFQFQISMFFQYFGSIFPGFDRYIVRLLFLTAFHKNKLRQEKMLSILQNLPTNTSTPSYCRIAKICKNKQFRLMYHQCISFFACSILPCQFFSFVIPLLCFIKKRKPFLIPFIICYLNLRFLIAANSSKITSFTTLI